MMRIVERGAGWRALVVWLLPALLVACRDDDDRSWGEPEVAGTVVENQDSPVGANAPPADSPGGAGMYQDGMNHASDWSSSDGEPFAGSADDGTPIPQGGQSALTTLFAGLDGQYPAGVYTLLYDGVGTIELGGDAKLVSEEPGKIVFEVKNPSDKGIVLEITSSDPADPVRNLRLLLPGQDGSGTFTQEFLDQFDQAGVIRAADVGLTLERMVELVNLVGADLWINVPHDATDEEIRAMAEYLQANLDPGLEVYLEYSSEVWLDNAQGAWMEEQGLLQGLSLDPMEARLRYYAERSLDVFGIFEDVFGGTDRLVRVLAAPASDPTLGAAILDWNQAYLEADAVAIAPTIGVVADSSNEEALSRMSVPEIVALIAASADSATQAITDYRVMAATRGLDLITYGGGVLMSALDTARSNVAIANLFRRALGDKGIKAILLSLLDSWREAGGKQFMHWAFNGEFGHSSKSPAGEALSEFIQRHPKWW